MAKLWQFQDRTQNVVYVLVADDQVVTDVIFGRLNMMSHVRRKSLRRALIGKPVESDRFKIMQENWEIVDVFETDDVPSGVFIQHRLPFGESRT